MLYPLSYGAWVQLTGLAAIWRGLTRRVDSNAGGRGWTERDEWGRFQRVFSRW
jgi:hypothetical protein